MRLRIRRCLLFALLLCLLYGIILGIVLMQRTSGKDADVIPKEIANRNVGLGYFRSEATTRKRPAKSPPRKGLLLDKLKPMNGDNEARHSVRKDTNDSPLTVQAKDKTKPLEVDLSHFIPPNYDIHAFYYTWYANPQFDGQYLHWNHQFLPHWNKNEMRKWKSGQHSPPEDIGANFYPLLGPYSSRDRSVITKHMAQLRQAGVGVLSLSWYPPNLADSAGEPTDNIVPVLLDIAQMYQIKINFHIEPYKNRDAQSLKTQVKYILQRYGDHPAFYRRQVKGRWLPLFYIYDSYLGSAHDWSTILKPGVPESVRGTDIDAIYIGLLVELKHKKDIVAGGFDGFYTYFASNRFTYGSSWTNWPQLASFAQANNLLFIPSVGPGYVDTEVRPWNGANTKERDKGNYYEASLKAAVDLSPSIITITSFNEWHEGTQIEPAVPKVSGDRVYQDYMPKRPDFYLELTKTWAQKYHKN